MTLLEHPPSEGGRADELKRIQALAMGAAASNYVDGGYAISLLAEAVISLAHLIGQPSVEGERG